MRITFNYIVEADYCVPLGVLFGQDMESCSQLFGFSLLQIVTGGFTAWHGSGP